MGSGKASVAVVGSYGVGLTMRLPRVPVAGETIAGGEFSSGHGGKGSNQAVGAARLGADVDLPHGHRCRRDGRRCPRSCGRPRAWTPPRPSPSRRGDDGRDDPRRALRREPDRHRDRRPRPSGRRPRRRPSVAGSRTRTSRSCPWRSRSTPRWPLCAPRTRRHVDAAQPGSGPTASGSRVGAHRRPHPQPHARQRSSSGHDPDAQESAADLAAQLHAKGVGPVVLTLGADGALVHDSAGAAHHPGRGPQRGGRHDRSWRQLHGRPCRRAR